MFSLGPPVELREDVCRLYEKYANRIPRGTLMMLSPPGGNQKFYVYEWFTKGEEKVFYVGKGTGRRYKHIIADMDRPRGAAYKELQKAFGIDSRFLAKDLTALEAELYELCTIIERTDAGEVLIQSANNPAMEKYWNSINDMMQICASRVFEPIIRVSEYRQRYFSVEVPTYDSFDATKLNVSFIASFNAKIPSVKVEMEKLKAAIESFGGKVFATICKKTQAIIEFDNIDYEDFIKYKSSGFSVYHAFDVANYLNFTL